MGTGDMGTLTMWIRVSEWNGTTGPLDDSKGTTTLGTTNQGTTTLGTTTPGTMAPGTMNQRATNQGTRPGCKEVKTMTPDLLPLHANMPSTDIARATG